MISFSNIDRLEELLSLIIQYGFDKKYLSKCIEDRLYFSKLIERLEKNDDSIIDKYSSDEIIKDVYSLPYDEEIDVKSTDLSLWISTTYLNLFFQYKKSFQYIFLYFPLEIAVEKYNLYHEMDISQLFALFEKRVKSQTLFSKILASKEMTTKQLAVLSDISIHTLNGYSKSDDILFGAGFDYIMLISQILNINPNVFMRNIYISAPVTSKLSKDEEIRVKKDTYLFFNTQDLNKKYTYDFDDDSFVSNEQVIKFYSGHNATYEDLVKIVDEYMASHKETFVVVQDKKIKENHINNKNIISISNTEIVDKKGRVKPIPSIIKEYALIKAKEPYFNL